MNPNNRKNRDTLKGYFKKGKTPTEEQFAELIDSTLNLVEDEQVIRIDSGWSFSVTPEKKLVIKNSQSEIVMEVSQDRTFLLYGNLTVEDTVTASTYKTKGGGGTTPGEDYLTIPADKKWHDLPLDVSREGFGCRVYRIYASFREPGTELCRLTRVTAIWLNFMEQRIESPEKHWWGWSGNIRFRWLDHGGKPCLQMRSKKRLPSGEIHCRIVEMYKG